MPIFICYMPILMYMYIEILARYTNIFSCYVKFKTCCLIIDVLYVKICTYCITIHLCYICVALSFLIFVVSTQICVVSTQQIYVVSKFVDRSTFSITPCSEKLSSLAVACGPTTYRILNYGA